MDARNYLTEKHIEFLNWVFNNKYYELPPEHRGVISTFNAETHSSLKDGYAVGSMYQTRLNQIRDKYLKEYEHTR